MMGYSSLSVRYAPRHAKDDYKHAAELAAIELAHKGRVWWIADIRGALYYGIPYASDDARYVPAVQTNVSEKTLSFLSAQDPPTLVLLSKPEFDPQNLVSRYLSRTYLKIADCCRSDINVE
jgi:hypothetical protein